MKQLAAVLLILSIFFLFSSCNKIDDETEAVSSEESYGQDYSALLKMPVGFVRNSNEAVELEYDRSMKNRFEAEALLPQNHKTINKKTEDVSILSVWNRSFTQLFIYGGGADKNSLNADLLFLIKNGELVFVFDKNLLADNENQLLIHEIYSADLNNDDIYEIYLNIETGSEKKTTVAGFDLADYSLISLNHSGKAAFYYFEDRLFLIRTPEDGGDSSANCILPILNEGELTSDEKASSQLRLAALGKWKNEQK